MELFSDIVLTKEDYDAADINGLVAGVTSKDLVIYANLFGKKLAEASEANDSKLQQLFKILLAVSEARLDVTGETAMFHPMLESAGGRTLVPDDVPEAHLSPLTDVVPRIKDAMLRARIADVIWTRRRSEYRMGIAAVEAYLQEAAILSDPQSWVGGVDPARRAMQIAVGLGKNGPSVQKTVANIETVINQADTTRPNLLPVHLMKVLLDYRQGEPSKYIPLTQAAAAVAEKVHEWETAREYWLLEGRWHKKNGDTVAERVAGVNAAETYVKLAEDYASTDLPQYISATAQLEQAIEAYRRLGQSTERVEALRVTLDDYQRKSTAEMKTFSVPIPGVAELAQKSVDAVKGKALYDAIQHLALFYQPPSLAELQTLGQQAREDDLILSLVSRSVVDVQGRTVARDSDETELERSGVVRASSMQQNYVAVVLIEPARWQIVQEHNITVDSLSFLVQNNPFIPPGHERIFAKGLVAGFHGDFLTATHLIIPQIEQSLRFMLELNGVIPYRLTEDMIQDAYLFDAVVRYKEIEQLMGEEVVLDLKVLLTNRFASNLRNRLAHGLMVDEEFESATVVYAWWLVLHLCFRALLVQRQLVLQAQQATTLSQSAADPELGNGAPDPAQT